MAFPAFPRIFSVNKYERKCRVTCLFYPPLVSSVRYSVYGKKSKTATLSINEVTKDKKFTLKTGKLMLHVSTSLCLSIWAEFFSSVMVLRKGVFSLFVLRLHSAWYLYIYYIFPNFSCTHVRMCVDMDATTLNFLLKDKPIIYIFSYLGKIINTLIQRLMGKDPFLRRHCLNSV